MDKIDRLLTVVETCFHKYRFSLNFGLGKTECMIQYRGKGALSARDSLYQNVIDDQGVMQRRGPSSRKHQLDVSLRLLATSNTLVLL